MTSPPLDIYAECLSAEDAQATLDFLSAKVVPNPRLRSQRWLRGVTADTPQMSPDNNPRQNPCVVKLLVASLDHQIIAAFGESFPIRWIKTRNSEIIWQK